MRTILHTGRRIAESGFVFLLLLLFLATAAEGKTGEVVVLSADLSPAKNVEGRLKPGLDPIYYLDYFKRDVRRLPSGEQSSVYTVFHGAPILELNHSFGKGEVFASGASRGVGIRMRGYLQFDQSGEYTVQALANDGIIVRIDGVEVLSDPMQHSDRLTDASRLTIAVPGWYPLEIDYFQRKGTATLKLLWQPPGSDAQVPIPAGAYGHIPNR